MEAERKSISRVVSRMRQDNKCNSGDYLRLDPAIESFYQTVCL